jgi:transcriptional regulator with XRE-family HTH domain
MGESFRLFVEERRKEISLTKSELAVRANLSRQGLYKIMMGDIDQVYLSTLVRLAVPLKVHPLVLIQKLFRQYEFPTQKTDGALNNKDATGFLADVTYPDNSIVVIGQRFKKVWRSQNIGKQVWQGCSLQCLDEPIQISSESDQFYQPERRRGLIPEQTTIPIPVVNPGEIVDLEVIFKAPSYPGSVFSYWKMVDCDGRLCFPRSEGLSCLVRVVNL